MNNKVRKTLLIFCIAFLILQFFSFSYSQDTKKSPWKTKIGAGVSYYSGNVDKLDLHGKGKVSREDSIIEFSSSVKFAYGEASSRKTNEQYSGGLKLDYLPHGKFSPFISIWAYNNIFKNLDLRLSGLAGLKYTLYEKNKNDYSISAAFIYDSEYYQDKIEDDSSSDSIFQKQKIRLSVRPKFSRKICENARLDHVTFFKFNVSNGQDYIIESSTSFETKITKKISLELCYEIDFENKPATSENSEIDKTDQALIISLVLNL